jgi:hypothetical protein
MESLEILSSDEFAAFSVCVKEKAMEKKNMKAQFKEIYDKFQADIKKLDQAILDAQTEFEEWKKTKVKN